MSTTPGAAGRQRPWLAPLVAVVLLVLIPAELFWYATGSFLADLCGSTEISRSTSPDGRHDAILFEHNCGVTTDFATHVSVLQAGASLGNDAGNAFAAETGIGGQRAPWGGPPVTATWDADGTLVISYDAAAEVLQTVQAVDGITIHSNRAP